MENSIRKNMNISIISDIIFNPYFIPSIKEHFDEMVKIYPIPYGEQSEDEHRKQLEKSEIIVIWLNLESSYLRACDALYSQFSYDQQIIDQVVASIYRPAQTLLSFGFYLRTILINYQL